MNNKVLKIIGFAATVISMATSLVTDWVDDKKIDNKISREIEKAMKSVESNDSK